MALKSEILKQSVTGNEKEKNCFDQIKCDQDLMRLNNELYSERKNSRRINLELSRIKTDLEGANKWTKSSMIVTYLGNNTRNIRTGIGYEQPMIENSLLCIICGNSGHIKKNCLKYRVSAEK